MQQRGRAADGDEPCDPRPAAVHHGAHDSPRRRLCLNVDDYGLHAGVNAAALQLAGAGRVHAIGCMVGAPAWPAGAEALRRRRDARIDVGLHLDLLDHPLQAGWTLPGLIAGGAAGRLDARTLRAEIRAQLDAFEQSLERTPDFVDGHRHVHQLPGVRELLLDELARRGAPAWLRSTRRARGTPSALKAGVIEALGAAGFAALVRQHGRASNRRLLGVYDFRGGAARYRTLLAHWLRIASDGDLLMCHPSRAAPGVPDTLLRARQAEYEVLADADFAAAGITLAPMSEILAG